MSEGAKRPKRARAAPCSADPVDDPSERSGEGQRRLRIGERGAAASRLQGRAEASICRGRCEERPKRRRRRQLRTVNDPVRSSDPNHVGSLQGPYDPYGSIRLVMYGALRHRVQPGLQGSKMTPDPSAAAFPSTLSLAAPLSLPDGLDPVKAPICGVPRRLRHTVGSGSSSLRTPVCLTEVDFGVMASGARGVARCRCARRPS